MKKNPENVFQNVGKMASPLFQISMFMDKRIRF